MRRIAVFTGTRAEYGLLYWLMKDIAADPQLELQTIVSAMHLSPEFGDTWRQIEADGFTIDARIETLLSSDTPVGVAKSVGLGTLGYADALDRLRPDALVILGDRFEALAAAQSALILGVPIVHLHGGELSEGAYDDAIRHAISKMATLHFVAAEPYRRRLIQMGEPPERVFNVGAMGLDHLSRGERMTSQKVNESLGFDLRQPYFLVTYHPATAADEQPAETAAAMLEALDAFRDHQAIITYPNADNGGRAIIAIVDAYARRDPSRVMAIQSLGFRRYLSVLAGAEAMIGNSSSGIIEAPAFGVPTVNIGSRQLGRLAAGSVVHCESDANSIRSAIAQAISRDFKAMAREVDNPYGRGDAASRIVAKLVTHPLTTAKHFNDLEFSL